MWLVAGLVLVVSIGSVTVLVVVVVVFVLDEVAVVSLVLLVVLLELVLDVLVVEVELLLVVVVVLVLVASIGSVTVRWSSGVAGGIRLWLGGVECGQNQLREPFISRPNVICQRARPADDVVMCL